MLDGNDATIWEYKYPWGNDTNYVRIVGDTVKVYDKFRIETIRGLQFPLEIFLAPFQDGNRWDGKLIAIDTSHVSFQSTIVTSSKTFKNGFTIYHHYLGPNIEYNDMYYFVPKIGFVKFYYKRYNLAPVNIELWQLKNYYLN